MTTIAFAAQTVSIHAADRLGGHGAPLPASLRRHVNSPATTTPFGQQLGCWSGCGVYCGTFGGGD
jgi:hypothetical protein